MRTMPAKPTPPSRSKPPTAAKSRAFSSAFMIALAGGAALGALTLLNWSALSHNSSAAASTTEEIPIERQVSRLMHRVGLEPQALAAAGVTPQQAGTIASRTESWIGENGATLDAQSSALRDATQQVSRLERKVRAGQASQEDLTTLAAARSSAASGQTAFDATLAAAFTHAAEGLGDNTKTALAQIKANRSWKVPVQYKVVGRTEGEWVSLRDALLEIRSASAMEREPGEWATDLVTAANADSAVAAAAVAVDNNLTGISNAIEDVFGPQ